MRLRQSIIFAVTVAVMLGLAVSANEKPPAAFQAAMKENGATLQKMAKDIEGKDYAAVAADAGVLKRNFAGPVGGYFKGAKNADALKLCTDAYNASDALEKAATAKSDADIATARTSVQGACGSCHKAWRVPLPDKTFEIKTN
jgi:cytochrome c556